MKKELRKKLDRIDKLAEEDDLYQYLMSDFKAYEDALFEMESDLSSEQRNVLWDFIMKSEQISQRLLEIACKNMAFMGPIRRFLSKKSR